MNWEGRRPNEPTCDYLGRVVGDYLQLPELAERARAAHFDDFFAPPEVADGMELLHLVTELGHIARGTNRAKRLRIREVVAAVKAGEFDGTIEESDRWAASKSGRDALNDPEARAAAAALLEQAKDPAALASAERSVNQFLDRVGASLGPDEDESEPTRSPS